MNMFQRLLRQARDLAPLQAGHRSLWLMGLEAIATATLAAVDGDQEALYTQIDEAFQREFQVALDELGITAPAAPAAPAAPGNQNAAEGTPTAASKTAQ